ncbi:ABC transporter ATP-binding protein [Thermohalobacter berrensis]|uniref:ABC transporter ATP-binding protein n=1 Tax=Thermohalobacter berrensis TaxID=99594 RepID=A0A419T4R2_9FIRM|nr:ABC transporter ATP-binding protein [Thermohalobacter berrensis]RKD32471.1 ABC transporter ATP-binding protein [Thermohalobacter berrensis]
MKTILEAKDVCKVFGKSREDETMVLKRINLQIEEGEFVAIMGQSGSGKSTLLYNISGMDRLTSGQVVFDGEDISDLSDEEISKVRLYRMGFIFQHSHLLKTLSIRENIMLPGINAGKKSRVQILNDANRLMEMVGIESIGGHDITKVSGGQLQRAAICRALINNPDIIYGDEPTGALNSRASQEVMNILNDINQNGTTLLIVTHDSKVAARADRVIYLSDGKIETEHLLGKYNREDDSLKERENNLIKWLKLRGF